MQTNIAYLYVLILWLHKAFELVILSQLQERSFKKKNTTTFRMVSWAKVKNMKNWVKKLM